MRALRLQFALLALAVLGLASSPGPRRLPAPLAGASHNLALTPDGVVLLVANPDSGSVTLVDTATRSVLSEIAVGADPRSVAAGTARAYVALQGDDAVAIVDLATRTVTGRLPVGDRPVAVLLSPDGRFLAVAEAGADAVRFVETASGRTLSVWPVADRPYGLAFTPDGASLLVAHLLDGAVTLLPARPYATLLPIVTVPIPVPATPGAPAPTPHTIATWPGVAPAPAVTVNAAGTRAYLPQTMANGLGQNTRFDTTVFPKVSVLNLEDGTHQTSEHISLPEVDQPVGLPWDVALSPAGTELWVANAGSADLSVIDLANPVAPARRAHLIVGANPRGLVISPDGLTAYVNNVLDGTVSVVDTVAYTVTGVITTTTIPMPPILLHGKRQFHSSASPDLARARWISCNTCHVEGEHDGRTWLVQFLGDLPPGATPVITRNTTSLLGMIETYPLRWSAEWDESADSEFSIRFEQFGEGLIGGDMHPTLGAPNGGRSYDLDCLAAFIDSLALPAPARPLTPAAARGQAIFASPQTGCLACHPPPLYTDLRQYDVGTANGPGEWYGPLVDTPTLRFLYDSAPYLHDGSAATLRGVLTTGNPSDAHGHTSHLSPAQLDDLVHFLLSLPYR